MSSAEESDESVGSLQQTQRKTTTSKTATPATRRASDAGHKKAARSASSDSSASTESSVGSSAAVRSTGAPFTTEEVKQKYLARGSIDNTPDVRTRKTSTSSSKETPAQKPFQSRFLNKTTTVPPPAAKEDEETETSSEEESESSDESEEDKPDPKEIAKSDIGALLARSANARDTSAENVRKTGRDEPPTYTSRSRYSSPKEESPVSPSSRYTRRTSAATTAHDDEPPSRYGYTSRFLNKSKSSAAIPPDEDDHLSRYGSSAVDDDSKYPSGRSRYMALKERRQRLARSRSSQQFGDEEDTEEPISPTSTNNPNAYLASRGYGSAASSGHDLARSRSSHALKSRDNSPDRSTAATEKDGAALSSWARYLKNKYGNRSGAKDKESSSSLTPSSSSSTTARRLSLGLPLRSSTEVASSDDDSKNMQGSPTTPTAATAVAGTLALLFLLFKVVSLVASIMYHKFVLFVDPDDARTNYKECPSSTFNA